MVARLKKEAERIIKELVELTWFMRGGIQYYDTFDLVPLERDSIKEFIKKNIDDQKELMHRQY